MKKRIIYVGVVIMLCMLLITLIGRYRYVDSYVSNNFSRDIKDTQNLVNEMYLELSYDGKYKDYSVEDMLEIVTDTYEEVDEIAYRITEYKTLNKNFDIRLYSLEGIIKNAQKTLEKGTKLSKEELELLSSLVALNDEYSELGNSSAYIDDHNILTLMDMPDKMDEYLDEIWDIEQKYNKITL